MAAIGRTSQGRPAFTCIDSLEEDVALELIKSCIQQRAIEISGDRWLKLAEDHTMMMIMTYSHILHFVCVIKKDVLI